MSQSKQKQGKLSAAKVLSTSCLASLMVGSLVSPASAAIDKFVLKDANGTGYEYNLTQIRQAFLGNSPFYQSYLSRIQNGARPVAFHDDTTNRYVDYTAIRDAYIASPNGFDANAEAAKPTTKAADFTALTGYDTVAPDASGKEVPTPAPVPGSNQQSAAVSSVTPVTNADGSVTLKGQTSNATDLKVTINDGTKSYDHYASKGQVTLNADGSFSFSVTIPGNWTYSVVAINGTQQSDAKTGSFTVAAPQGLAVSSVSAIDATTVQVTFPAASTVAESDLTGKTVKVSDGTNTFAATYKAGSLSAGKATFSLGGTDKLVDATTYTVSADWASVANNSFVAKLADAYAATFAQQTTNVTPVTVPDDNPEAIYFTAKDQYGQDIVPNPTNTANVTLKATLNGMPLSTKVTNNQLNNLALQIQAPSEVTYNRGDNFVSINRTLVEGDQLVVTLTSNKVDSTFNYTVVKTPAGGLVASSIDLTADKTSVASNSPAILTVSLKDQFNNPVKINYGDIRWFVNDVEDTSQTGGTYTFTETASQPYVVKAFYTANSKLNKSITINVGAADLTSLTAAKLNSVIVYDKEAAKVVSIKQNDGAILNPQDLKVVFTSKPANSNPTLTFAYGVDDPATTGVDESKIIYGTLNADVPGDYSFKVYTGNKLDQNGNVVANGSGVSTDVQTITSNVRKEVNSISVEDFKTNELTNGGSVTKAITFTNVNGENFDVNADKLSVTSTSGVQVKMLDKDKKEITENQSTTPVKYLEFDGKAQGTDTVTIVSGKVSKSLTTTTAAAAALKTIQTADTATVINQDVSAATRNGVTETKVVVNGKAYVLVPVSFTDNYGNTLDVIANALTYTGTGATVQFFQAQAQDGTYSVAAGSNKVAYVGYYVNEAANQDGTYSPVKVTIADGNISKDVTVNVLKERTIDSLAVSSSSVQLAVGATGSVTLTPKDQYGQLIKLGEGQNITVAASKAGVITGVDTTPAKATLKEYDVDSKFAGYTVDLTGASKDSTTLTFAWGNKNATVNATVGSVGSLVSSVAIDKSGIKPLYSTVGASTNAIDLATLTATAKDANGNTVTIDPSSLIWSISSASLKNTAGSDVAASDALTLTNNKLSVKAAVKGTVTVQVQTPNLKSDTVTLNLDNAEQILAANSLGVTEAKALDADSTTAGIQVKLDGDGTVDKELNGAIHFTLTGVDQYGKTVGTDKIDESKAIVTTDDSSVAAVKAGDGDISVTAVGVGDANVYVQYEGQTVVLNVNVIQKAVDAANQAAADAAAAGVKSIDAPEQGATSLTLPSVAGYTVAIKSSDSTVIDTDGTITPPATDTQVNLVLTLTNNSTGKKADTASIAVVVPAQ